MFFWNTDKKFILKSTFISYCILLVPEYQNNSKNFSTLRLFKKTEQFLILLLYTLPTYSLDSMRLKTFYY